MNERVRRRASRQLVRTRRKTSRKTEGSFLERDKAREYTPQNEE